MPSNTSKKKPAATLPSIPKELIDQMVSGPMEAEAVNAASMAFKKALIERILSAELGHHLGYPPAPEDGVFIGIRLRRSIQRIFSRADVLLRQAQLAGLR